MPRVSHLNRIYAACFAVTFLLVARPVIGDDLPRIVVFSIPEAKPAANKIVEIIDRHLVDLEIDLIIESRNLGLLPTNTSQWLEQAKKAAADTPGTVATFGYKCDQSNCIVYCIEPRSAALLEFSVEVPDHADLDAAFALAAAMRETLLGPVFPELKRLVREGKNPGPPPPAPESVWLKPPLEKERKRTPELKRSWLWLEGGYQGDHPHPDGHPIHGAWFGLNMEPRKMIGAVISVGWMGIREGEISPGTAKVHRITSSLALRIIFPVGPAHISIAPLGRLDVTFVELIPNNRSGTSWADLELQAGGLTTWHLPLNPRLEAIVGAGVLASILSNEISIYNAADDKEVAIPATSLRVVWMVGIAWSPLDQ
jgi:hypothetical protein